MKWLWLKLFDGWLAEIKVEARKRALDEFEALATGTTIEAGVGRDVEQEYWFLIRKLRR